MNPSANVGVEIVVAGEKDLDGILQLQAANQISNGGSLSASFPRSRIISMMSQMPLLVARRDNRVIGFLMCSTVEMSSTVPVIKAMLEAYPNRSHDAYVYGPICIDAKERGRGLAQSLYSELRRRLPGREGILFIRSDNESSIKAHRKMGMREVSRFLFGGVEHIVLAYVG